MQEPIPVSWVTGALIGLSGLTGFALSKLFHAQLELMFIFALVGWTVIGALAMVWRDSVKPQRAAKLKSGKT